METNLTPLQIEAKKIKDAEEKTKSNKVNLSIETRYYLFENNSTNQTKTNFILQILLLSKEVQRFDLGIGEFILAITSRFDDSSENDDTDVSDIIFNFRKEIIKKKEYNRKPNPKRYWKGEWKVLVNNNFV